MKITRVLCNRFPAQRIYILGFAYLNVLVLGTFWLACFVIPAIAFLFLDPSHYLLAARGMPPLSPRATMMVCWFFTIVGLISIYFTVRDLRTLRLKNPNVSAS
jgi:lysylphosphatidylglycerol synthetase-like protein (DUF2156 family)